MMSQFYKAFDAQRDSYLAHHGVKGMKWGVRKEYVPVGQREASYQEMPQTRPQTVSAIRDASPEKVQSTGRKVAKGLLIAGGVAAALAGIAGGVVAYKKLQRPFVGSEAGEKLKRAVEG